MRSTSSKSVAPALPASETVVSAPLLVALEISGLSYDIIIGAGTALNPMQQSPKGAFLSDDMDNSDTLSESSARMSADSVKDLEAQKDSSNIQDTTVAEITILFPLPCKDPMSEQRKMFDFVRALNLGAG